jgi:(1->4)-alpha-D-glucan 1-alpha-D-glucosylmutase
VPRATYRIQFNHTFTFRDAIAIVPYLADLGVSHLYASPIFTAAKGSMHGYDVVDYSAINPEIGTEADFDALVDALHDRDMGLIVDFVPNHMGIEGGQNPWWQDVLEHGPWSPYAEYFDIDWEPLKRELRGKVLLPFLGGQYGDVLEAGELKLSWSEDRFVLHYWDTPFPIAVRSWPIVLEPVAAHLAETIEPDHIDLLELQSISATAAALEASFASPDPESVEIRRRETVVIRHRLASLIERSPDARAALDAVIARFNGTDGDPASFDAIDRLLDRQWYRLAFWRVASEEINYRRFFAINSLAAIRQEEPEVFTTTHDLLLRLCVAGKIDGVRIDHPDGLWDPAGYFRQLQHAYLQAIEPTRSSSEIDAELDRIAERGEQWPLFVVVEKILEHGETLPADWAIAGTVGYEFAQATTGLYVDTSARVIFDRIFTRFTGDSIRFPDLVYEMKHWMMRNAFASEINVLTNLLNRISEQDRHSRDFTANSLRNALREVIAGFSIYRTYTTCDQAGVVERDRRFNDAAIAFAKKRSATLDPSIFDFVQSVLQLHAVTEGRARMNARCHFAMKLQQLTGPVMAKALEDTAFYRFNRLVSLNEVGGDPGHFGSGIEEFHRQNRNRLKSWPHNLLTSSTHDTKRSEDVRARISVLSEIPTEWRAAINRWSRANRKLRTRVDGALAPHRADEYVIYQTLLGTWPLEGITRVNRADYIERLQEYMIKVVREATRFSNWVNPNDAYEDALRRFIAGLFDARRSRVFLEDFSTFEAGMRPAGLANAISQQVLKLTAPGVPDIYQGTETWDDSLVDPDNRRPVDYERLRALLSTRGDRESDSPKVRVTQAILRLRSERPDLFANGDYHPLAVEGPRSDNVVAFARSVGDDVVIVLAGRLVHGAGDPFANPPFWEGTTIHLPANLERRAWANRLDEASITTLDCAILFASQPVAVLTSWETQS